MGLVKDELHLGGEFISAGLVLVSMITMLIVNHRYDAHCYLDQSVIVNCQYDDHRYLDQSVCLQEGNRSVIFKCNDVSVMVWTERHTIW